MIYGKEKSTTAEFKVVWCKFGWKCGSVTIGFVREVCEKFE